MLRPEGSKPPRWIHFLKILTSPWSLPSNAIPWSRPSSNIEIRHSSTASSVLLQVCRHCTVCHCCWMLTPDSTAHCGSGPELWKSRKLCEGSAGLNEHNVFDPNSTAVDINACICMHMRWRDTQVYKYKVYNHLRMYCIFAHTMYNCTTSFLRKKCVHICMHLFTLCIQMYTVYSSIHTNYYLFQFLNKQRLHVHPSTAPACCWRGNVWVSSQVLQVTVVNEALPSRAVYRRRSEGEAQVASPGTV